MIKKRGRSPLFDSLFSEVFERSASPRGWAGWEERQLKTGGGWVARDKLKTGRGWGQGYRKGICKSGSFSFVEAVANPGLGNDIFWLSWVGLYLLTQVPDIDAHIIQVIDVFPAPHPL